MNNQNCVELKKPAALWSYPKVLRVAIAIGIKRIKCPLFLWNNTASVF
jgi:hypothetical protein